MSHGPVKETPVSLRSDTVKRDIGRDTIVQRVGDKGVYLKQARAKCKAENGIWVFRETSQAGPG